MTMAFRTIPLKYSTTEIQMKVGILGAMLEEVVSKEYFDVLAVSAAAGKERVAFFATEP